MNASFLQKSPRVGLAVIEAQTLHYGHLRLLTQMKATTKISIVALGSVKKHGVYGHPFTFDQRRAMIQMVFGDEAFKFVPLDDIDSTIDNDEWIQYVIAKIGKTGLPAPTDYFTGSAIDAKWYENRFASISRSDTQFMRKTATAEIFENIRSGQRLHLIERAESGIPSGREIRFLIERRDPDWKNYVPEILHDYIEAFYPPRLRQAMTGTTIPDPETTPVGTRFLDTFGGGSRILELKDDNVWRLANAADEKAEWAKARHQTT